MNPLGMIYFYVCAALALAGAVAVVAAKNPIRGAMGLLLLILTVAGLFLALHAEFLAAIQLIVYAGAIVVLFLFVIMLLGPSAATPSDRRGIILRVFGGGLFGLASLGALGATVRAMAEAHRTMPMPPPEHGYGGIDAFGAVLFSDALAPFELSSALLMVAVVGAIAVARGRQGAKSMSRSEQGTSRLAMADAGELTKDLPRDHSGVFSHEIDAHLPTGGPKEHSA
ncbi:MAG: NADH-quinone oxidoreductase subunit J [Myxococcota bacterium]|nr:NADH-quinone oxidoreductase subunit J [Myxococcota bacterium]